MLLYLLCLKKDSLRKYFEYCSTHGFVISLFNKIKKYNNLK